MWISVFPCRCQHTIAQEHCSPISSPASHDWRIGCGWAVLASKASLIRTKPLELNNSIFYVSLYCKAMHETAEFPHSCSPANNVLHSYILQYCISCKDKWSEDKWGEDKWSEDKWSEDKWSEDKWGESGHIHPQAYQTVQSTINDVLQQERWAV